MHGSHPPLSRAALFERAFQLLHTPYGWGGTGSQRDCSRLLMDLFASFGVLLPRNSRQQAQAGVERMTVIDSQGFARQRGRTEMYRGQEYKLNLLRKVTLEIVVNDDFLERTLEIVASVARTGTEGAIGDGKLFVLPMEEAIELRGPRGPQAV